MKDLIIVELTQEQACHFLEKLTDEYDGEPCFDDAASLKYHISNMQTMLALSASLGLDHWSGLCAEEMMQRIEDETPTYATRILKDKFKA
jgi:hypothetical protein